MIIKRDKAQMATSWVMGKGPKRRKQEDISKDLYNQEVRRRTKEAKKIRLTKRRY